MNKLFYGVVGGAVGALLVKQRLFGFFIGGIAGAVAFHAGLLPDVTKALTLDVSALHDAKGL